MPDPLFWNQRLTEQPSVTLASFAGALRQGGDESGAAEIETLWRAVEELEEFASDVGPRLSDLETTAADAEKAVSHVDALWNVHEKQLIELGGEHVRALFNPDENDVPGGTLAQKCAALVRVTECALLYVAARKEQENT